MSQEIVKNEVQTALEHIREQVEKDQFWNAIATATLDLMPALLKGFDWFLKNRNTLARGDENEG